MVDTGLLVDNSHFSSVLPDFEFHQIIIFSLLVHDFFLSNLSLD